MFKVYTIINIFVNYYFIDYNQNVPLKFQKNHLPKQAMRAIYPTFLQEVWDYFIYFVSVFLIVACVYSVVRFAVFNSIRVSGASMQPYHETNDLIYIDLISKNFSDYRRGDIIVFTSDKACDPKEDLFIKRIIGLPGERLVFENGVVYIDNPKLSSTPIKLDESGYLSNSVYTHKTITPLQPEKPNYEPKTIEKIIGKDEYYFMGDNRTGSLDARKCGPINKSKIIGKEFFRFLPENKRGTTKLPSYNIQSQ